MSTLPAALLGAPIWLVVLAVFVLVAVPCLVVLMGWLIVRRAASSDLPQVLLGLSHVISAFCGLLPWGKPSLPAEPLQPDVPAHEAGAGAPQTLVVVRNDTALHAGRPGEER